MKAGQLLFEFVVRRSWVNLGAVSVEEKGRRPIFMLPAEY